MAPTRRLSIDKEEANQSLLSFTEKNALTPLHIQDSNAGEWHWTLQLCGKSIQLKPYTEMHSNHM